MKKLTLADRLLAKFAAMPKSTANEVGINGIMLVGVQLSSAPKRAADLHKHGYLRVSDRRQCRESGKLAMEFVITEHGINHLRMLNIPFSLADSDFSRVDVVPERQMTDAEVIDSKKAAKSAFASMRASLS